jgi:hypothetical protein
VTSRKRSPQHYSDVVKQDRARTRENRLLVRWLREKCLVSVLPDGTEQAFRQNVPGSLVRDTLHVYNHHIVLYLSGEIHGGTYHIIDQDVNFEFRPVVEQRTDDEITHLEGIG